MREGPGLKRRVAEVRLAEEGCGPTMAKSLANAVRNKRLLARRQVVLTYVAMQEERRTFLLRKAYWGHPACPAWMVFVCSKEVSIAPNFRKATTYAALRFLAELAHGIIRHSNRCR